MFTIQRLTANNIQPFLFILEPGLRGTLLQRINDDTQLIFGAVYWGQPAGVAVFHVTDEAGRLSDLYVLPAYRRAGIGTGLLAAGETAVAQAGLSRIQTLYRHNEQTPAFEALLTKQGWTPPILQNKIFWTRCAVAFGRWVSRYRFRPPYELFAWTDLTDSERQIVQERGQAGWYPALFNPFHRADDAWDPQTSIGLRYKGEVVGWCLTVREKTDVILIDIMFVDPPLQPLGRGFMLVGEVIRRGCASGCDYGYWRVDPANEPMIRWSHKAFAGDGLIDQYDQWHSEKEL